MDECNNIEVLTKIVDTIGHGAAEEAKFNRSLGNSW